MPTVEPRKIFVDENGTAWIEGTGTKVLEVAIEKTAWGLTAEQMVEDHPQHWTLGEVHAALSYFYDHKDEVDADIARREAWVEEMRAEQEARYGESPFRRRMREMGKLPSQTP